MKEPMKETGGFLSYSSITFFFSWGFVLVRMVLINQNLFSDSRRTLVLKLKNCSDNWSLFGAISDTRTTLEQTHGLHRCKFSLDCILLHPSADLK
jgi:hypothetical protein